MSTDYWIPGTVFVPGQEGAGTEYGVVNQGGDYTVLARVYSLFGTGSIAGVGEANCLVPTDVQAITCRVFDLGTNLNNPAGTELLPAPALLPVLNLYAVLQTLGWPVDRDQFGYNFRHKLDATYCPEAGHWYLVEYRFAIDGIGTGSGSGDQETIWLRTKVKSVPIQSVA